jgi:hypothetical protein
MLKNNVEPDMSQMTIWCVHIACWIPKATNTHSKYVIFIAIPRQLLLHERASMLRNAYIIACFFAMLCGVLWCECDTTDIVVVMTDETFVLSLESPFNWLLIFLLHSLL